MPDRERGLRRARTLLIIGTAVLWLLVLGSIGFGLWAISQGGFSGSCTLGSVERTTAASWSFRYARFSGSKQKTLRCQPGELLLTVTTEEGGLAILVQDAEGALLFDEEALATGSYPITVAGPVTVTVQASGHKGGYQFDLPEGASPGHPERKGTCCKTGLFGLPPFGSVLLVRQKQATP